MATAVFVNEGSQTGLLEKVRGIIKDLGHVVHGVRVRRGKTRAIDKATKDRDVKLVIFFTLDLYDYAKGLARVIDDGGVIVFKGMHERVPDDLDERPSNLIILTRWVVSDQRLRDLIADYLSS